MKKKYLLLILVVVIFSMVSSSIYKFTTRKAHHIIYFSPTYGAQLSKDELKIHPEILTVYSDKELKKFYKKGVSIWIDKGADYKDLVHDKDDWLFEKTKEYCPVFFIGNSNDEYVFRNTLGLIRTISVSPEVIFKESEIQGFSVLILQSEITTNTQNGTNYETNIMRKGYNCIPTVNYILKINQQLVHGK